MKDVSSAVEQGPSRPMASWMSRVEDVQNEVLVAVSLHYERWKFPSRLEPYAELIRIWKPVGFLYLYLPCLFGTLLAGILAEESKTFSDGQLVYVNVVFFIGSFMVRSFGCTWNDICDQDFDRRVTRTRHRPLARGTISTSNALIFAGGQLLFGMLTVLITLPLTCFWLAAPSIILGLCYPLGKRVTNYPQVLLGLTFSWGVWLAFPALGQPIDPVLHPGPFNAALLLYLACTVWTIIYDTAYAAQDFVDDRREKIGSTFVRFANQAKIFLSSLLIVFALLLLFLGHSILATWRFYSIACGAAIFLLAAMIWNIDLARPLNCIWWFNRSAILVGGSIAGGLALELWCKRADSTAATY